MAYTPSAGGSGLNNLVPVSGAGHVSVGQDVDAVAKPMDQMAYDPKASEVIGYRPIQVNPLQGQPLMPSSSNTFTLTSPGAAGGIPVPTPSQSVPVREPIIGITCTRKELQELVKTVDPTEQLDEDVEDLLLSYAEHFMETVMEGACTIAAHRKSKAVEVKDVQLYLERGWNMWVPGFGTDELRPYKRAPVTEAHKQRLALIKKLLKKY